MGAAPPPASVSLSATSIRFYLISFSSSPSSPPPRRDLWWRVAVFYINGFRVILEVGFGLGGPCDCEVAGGHLEPQAGVLRCQARHVSRALVTVSRLRCFGFVLVLMTGPRVVV